MNKFIYALLSILLIPLVYTCKHNSSDNLLQQVRGDANDVVVVMSDNYWDGKSGDLIKERFNAPCVALPQDEPTFDILHTSHNFFDQVYKRQRNILVVQIGPNYKKNLVVQNNVWAKPQIVVSVMAHTQEEFDEYLPTVIDQIVELIQDKERERLLGTYKTGLNRDIERKLESKHNVKLAVPKGYNIAADTNNFIWLHSSYRDIQEGILLYYYTYTDTNTFTKDYLINKRNIFLKKYLEGSIEGSFMSTEERFPIYFKEFSMGGETYTAETRGLWNMRNGTAMGGPFVSITQYDKERQRIVTAEGFVFAPSEKKRNLLRRVEAIVYSMQFIPEETK